MTKFRVVAAFLVLFPVVAIAQQQDDVEMLAEALGIGDVVEIMRQEGLVYAQELDQEMLSGQGGAGLAAQVEEIYSAERMQATFSRYFRQELDSEDLSVLIAFFSSELGQRIVALELSGRRALLDETVEELSLEALRDAEADGSARLGIVKIFSDVNGLIETNIEGAMNANFAFYEGLQAGGAFDKVLTESQILNDVWAMEPEIRKSTRDWVYSYLLMAYGPLSDEDLQAYIDLSKSPAGQAMNQALFVAFDVMFVDISRALGLSVARYMVGEDI